MNLVLLQSELDAHFLKEEVAEAGFPLAAVPIEDVVVVTIMEKHRWMPSQSFVDFDEALDYLRVQLKVQKAPLTISLRKVKREEERE
jgi:hypothetical protein